MSPPTAGYRLAGYGFGQSRSGSSTSFQYDTVLLNEPYRIHKRGYRLDGTSSGHCRGIGKSLSSPSEVYRLTRVARTRWSAAGPLFGLPRCLNRGQNNRKTGQPELRDLLQRETNRAVQADPFSHRLRETLFDILGPRTEGAIFLDAYAGTGAVGIEALSRGAHHAYFLERNRHALNTIRENLAELGIEARATVVAGPVLLTLPRHQAGIVFLDPPYSLEREYAAALEALGEAPPELVVAQHSVRFALAEAYGPLARVRVVRQGDNALSFYAPRRLE